MAEVLFVFIYLLSNKVHLEVACGLDTNSCFKCVTGVKKCLLIMVQILK